ncbi:hypothetical protein ACFOYU_20635 [Microvirga sp. GCM10011540]
MAETYRGGASRLGSGTGMGSPAYGMDDQRRAISPDYDEDLEGYDYDQWGDYDERQRTRTGLALDDGIILLGILLGGTAGYMIASSVRTDQVGSKARRRFGRSGDSQYSGHRDQRRS